VCDLAVRGTGTVAAVFPTFVLVSRIQFVEQYRDNHTCTQHPPQTLAPHDHIHSGTSVFWVSDQVYGLQFPTVWPLGLDLLYVYPRNPVYPRCLDPPDSEFSLSLHRHPFLCTLCSSHVTLTINNNNDHFLNSMSSSRHETMVDGVLPRVSVFRVDVGVGGDTIVSGSCTHPSYSWISRFLTSSLSLGISSLFCRTTQCMWDM
jgi:hypothetical protein